LIKWVYLYDSMSHYTLILSQKNSMFGISKLIWHLQNVPYSTKSSLVAEAFQVYGFGMQLYEYTYQDCGYISGL